MFLEMSILNRPIYSFGKIIVFYFSLSIVAVCAAADPVRIILDTDMAGDCDDAGALALLHALADNGEAEILAIMHNTGNPYSVGCIDAINTYYNRPDIPVGAYKGELLENSTSKYAKAIAENFPNDIFQNNNTLDAVALYRSILAAQDRSVIIVSIGFLTNLENLLTSLPDQHSPSNGPDLIRNKVSKLVVMGGQYPAGSEFNFSAYEIGGVTKFVIDNWPTPVLFSGFEIGDKIKTGIGLRQTSPQNPVREIYRLFFDGSFQNRGSYDQTAVLTAVRGLRNYWTTVSVGHNHIHSDGSNTWSTSPDKEHDHLVKLMPETDLAYLIENLMIQNPKFKISPPQLQLLLLDP